MKPDALATQIEMYLLLRGDWVSVSELSERFAVPERLLRADGKRRPLLARFAISSTRNRQHGFKHLSVATVRERLEYKHNRLKRLIAERRALDAYNDALHNCLTGKHPVQIERHTGQTILPI